MRLLKWLCLLVLCLFALDALYALYIHAARVLEEKNTVRNEKGVREGCEAFDMGEGEVAILCVHGFGDSPALWKKWRPHCVGAKKRCK